MKLYDEVIREIDSILRPYRYSKLDAMKKCRWKDVGKESMILRGDMAYELGGSNLAAMGSMLLTDNADLVPGDEICLYGKDLSEIREDTPFVRIAIVRVKPEGMGEGNALYNAIRKLEFTKYHIFPDGYMMRISAASDREMVRISKEAVKKRISFREIGKMFIDGYHKSPQVEAVKMIFITLPDVPYEKLHAQVKKSEEITKAIDHILKNLAMDCNVCNLKQICDEVEGMKELHFKNQMI